jgi:DNA-binding GntR family transcriptional regulator
MAVPDINDPRPIYVQIADHLRNEIKGGRLAPGTRMPPQRDLAEKYGVAPGTLRSALDELVRDGIVSAGNTRGTFVLKIPGEPEPSPEYMKLAEQVSQLADRLDALETRMGQVEDRDGASA